MKAETLGIFVERLDVMLATGYQDQILNVPMSDRERSWKNSKSARKSKPRYIHTTVRRCVKEAITSSFQTTPSNRPVVHS